MLDYDLIAKMAREFHGARAMGKVVMAMRPNLHGQKTLEKAAVTNLVFGDSFGGVYISTNQACHAGLNLAVHASLDGVKEESLKYVLSGIQLNINEYDYSLCERFYEWLVNNSPWASVFLTTSGKEAIECGFLLARTDVPGNLLASAMIASRLCTELDRGAKYWNKYISFGATPELAFLFCHEISINSYGFIYPKVELGHVCYPGGSMDKKEMSTFLSGKIPNTDLYTERYDKSRSYIGVDSLLTRQTTEGGIIKKCLVKTAQKIGVKKVSNNPFTQAQSEKMRCEHIPELISTIKEELQ